MTVLLIGDKSETGSRQFLTSYTFNVQNTTGLRKQKMHKLTTQHFNTHEMTIHRRLWNACFQQNESATTLRPEKHRPLDIVQ